MSVTIRTDKPNFKPSKLETNLMRLESTGFEMHTHGPTATIGTMQSATYQMYGSDKQIWRKLEQLKKKFPNSVSFQIRNEYRGINLIEPKPAYLYRHRSTMVQCYGCLKRFPHTQLIDESGDMYNGIPDVENGCPNCGMGDCCIIEYETIGDFLLKKNGVPKTISGVG